MRENERSAGLRLLRDVAGGPVAIDVTEVLGSDWTPVERWLLSPCEVVAQLGTSVVVKTRRHDESGWGGDPANLATEYRALATLQAAGVDVAPELLAWDDKAGVLVMSDLAPARPVEDILSGSDPGMAADALVAMATAVGTMHAATAGMARETWNPSAVLEQDLRAQWARLAGAATRMGFPEPGTAGADVAAIASTLADDAWRTLTHGDLTPGNALLDGAGTARLVDFEGAGPRHCLYDGAMLSLSFPHYGHWAALPVEVVTRMEGAYRAALACGLPLAADDAAWTVALAAGCLAWTLIRLVRLDTIARTDQEPDQALRRRTQIVHTVESCVDVARRAGAYPTLTRWLEAVAREIRRRWPEANTGPRQFPALA